MSLGSPIGKEKPLRLSFSRDGNEAGWSPPSTQNSDDNCCKGSIGGHRHKKYHSGGGSSGGKLKKVSLDCFDNDKSFYVGFSDTTTPDLPFP